MFKFNEMFFYETIENINCQGCRIQQPIEKKKKKTLTKVLKYMF